MRKIGNVLAAIWLAIITFAPTAEAALSSNHRRAVVLEAFYALRPSHDGGCDKTTSDGRCLSNWNYLANDLNAYNTIKSAYVCNSSDWAVPGETCYGNYISSPMASFYSNVASYGYGTFGGPYGNIGHGGQCRFFANLVVYRSGAYSGTGIFPNYPTMWTNVQTDLTKAVEGDVLTSSNGYHTAIVVEIKRTGSTVTGLDVIDSNWVPDISGGNREVIGRHVIALTAQPQGGAWGLWKGASYYNEPYVP
ncbi:MAG TPA: hypothetical protein VIE43_16400 [Thermoanaerobaculia bacterium]|jgi:hypothetical protein|nr:hypothetical protein [Thermoanaerobaculia bacterium]